MYTLSISNVSLLDMTGNHASVQSNRCVLCVDDTQSKLKHTTTLFASPEHYILSQECRVIVDQVQTNYHGRHVSQGAHPIFTPELFKLSQKHQGWAMYGQGHILLFFYGSQAELRPWAPYLTNPRWLPFKLWSCHNLSTNRRRDACNTI